MKAVILVGGYGTRLRPFTFTQPKSLVPFANLPIMEHQIAALAKAGVDQVILAVGHLPHLLLKQKEALEKTYNITIHFSIEDVPLGTAGPLALCRELLQTDAEPFFMLNSDVACEFPFERMLNYHKSHGKEGTICVTPVEDPSRYGLVVYDKTTGEIKEFLEKPESPTNSYPSNTINAGIYLLNKSVLNRIPMFGEDCPARSVSIEREIFPEMVVEKNLYAMLLPGYWMDIGQPKDFLVGTRLHLETLNNSILSPSFGKNVLIDPSATVSPAARLGPNVVIGPGCVVGEHALLKNCTLMEKTIVESSAFVSDSIIGWESKIRSHAKVEKSYLGADVDVGAGVFIYETTICPHKGIKTHSFSGVII